MKPPVMVLDRGRVVCPVCQLVSGQVLGASCDACLRHRYQLAQRALPGFRSYSDLLVYYARRDALRDGLDGAYLIRGLLPTARFEAPEVS